MRTEEQENSINTERIDKLFESIQTGDEKKVLDVIYELITPETKSTIEEKGYSDDDYEILKIMFKDIVGRMRESGTYEYFQEKGYQSEDNIEVMMSIITETKLPVPEVKQYLKNPIIAKSWVTKLVTATEDFEFVEEFLENDDIAKRLNGYDIESIITNLGVLKKEDSKELIGQKLQFVKECLTNEDIAKRLRGSNISGIITNLGVPEKEDSEELIGQRLQFVKECLTNEDIADKLGESILKIIEDIVTLQEEDTKEIIGQKLELVKEYLIENKNIIVAQREISIAKVIHTLATSQESETETFKKRKFQFVKECLVTIKKSGIYGLKTFNYLRNCECMDSRCMDSRYIKENLDLFMELENANNRDVKKERLEELYETNEDIYYSVNFEILDDKYWHELGKEKVNIIATFQYIQNAILKLNENQYKAFLKVFNNSLETDKDGAWRYRIEEFLKNVKQYDKLVENIDEFKDEDIDSFKKIVQNKNTFDIETIEELRDYENIKRQKCDEMMLDDNLEVKKNALLYKTFGHDLSTAKEIVERYGEDNESLEDSYVKEYVKALKMILDVENSDVLESVYKETEEIELTDKIAIEKS